MRSAGGMRGRRGGQLGGLVLEVFVAAVMVVLLVFVLGSFLGLGIFSALVMVMVGRSVWLMLMLMLE